MCIYYFEIIIYVIPYIKLDSVTFVPLICKKRSIHHILNIKQTVCKRVKSNQ